MVPGSSCHLYLEWSSLNCLGLTDLYSSFKMQGYSVQFNSVAQLCPTLCDPWTAACQASLSITMDWLKSSFGFLYDVTGNLNELFGQCNLEDSKIGGERFCFPSTYAALLYLEVWKSIGNTGTRFSAVEL